jgi:hypothetical protein
MVALEFLLFIDSRNEKKRELGGEKDNKTKKPDPKIYARRRKAISASGFGPSLPAAVASTCVYTYACVRAYGEALVTIYGLLLC